MHEAEYLLPVLNNIVKQKAAIWPKADIHEIYSAGAVGMMQAYNKHKDKPEVEVKRLAGFRIRGAMIDYLRDSDLLSRRTRARSNYLQKVQDELGDCTVEELAEYAELPVRLVESTLAQRDIKWVSLDADRISSHDSTPYDDCVLAERRYRIIEAVAGLSERLRDVIWLKYYEDKTLYEIGNLLGVSRSRVCQLHAIALEKLEKLIEV